MPKIVIIGGGPAGLSAAIYASRANLETTVLYTDGGALGKTDKIENYFGFPEAVSGAELLARGQAQAKRLGAALVQAEATGIEYTEAGFVVKSTAGVFPATRDLVCHGRAARGASGCRRDRVRGPRRELLARCATLSFTAARRRRCSARANTRWKKRACCCRSQVRSPC